MSLLHFVQQYQQIQDKCLVSQDQQDFRTDEKQRRRWSRYPIERHAASLYTKNMFYKFSKEFEKIVEYDVRQEGQHQYWLEPNNNFVYGYGKRTYLVTAIKEHESYLCECNKIERDGVICCHIMKVMTRLGVKIIPERYINKRWTQQAVPGDGNAEPSTHMAADFVARGMPISGARTLRYTNLSIEFAKFAIEGSLSDENYAVVQNHIVMIHAELEEIKKKKIQQGKKPVETPAAASAQHEASTQHEATNHASIGQSSSAAATVPHGAAATATEEIRNPPRSKPKGRKKEKREKKGKKKAKRKNRCSTCGLTGHNSARCPNKKALNEVVGTELQLFS